MRYNKLIKLANYFKSSGNKDIYFQLLKLASFDRFQALVLGSYPQFSGGEREATIRRGRAIDAIRDEGDKDASISNLAKIISESSELSGLDKDQHISIWSMPGRSGNNLSPKDIADLDGILDLYKQNNQQSSSSGDSNRSRESARSQNNNFSWGGLDKSAIINRLSGLVPYHKEIIKNLRIILGSKINVPNKQDASMFSFVSRDPGYESGSIVNYNTETKMLRMIKSFGSYGYAYLTPSLIEFNKYISEDQKSAFEFLAGLRNPFAINVPRSRRDTYSKGFITDVSEVDGGVIEVLVEWPPEEGDRGIETFKKNFRSDDTSLANLFSINPGLFR